VRTVRPRNWRARPPPGSQPLVVAWSASRSPELGLRWVTSAGDAGGDLEQAAVALYADRAQRMEIANAIVATGSDDETTWLAVMEAMTGP